MDLHSELSQVSRIGLGCIAFSWLSGLLAGQGLQAELTSVQVGSGEQVIGALGEDLDEDGLVDLVLVTHRGGEGMSGGRYLQVHMQGQGSPPFSNRPVREPWRLPANVVGFAVADVHENPGRELVLLSPSLAVAVYWVEGEADPRVERLCETSLLWQPAREWGIVSWQAGMRDLDGDGLVDLLLPEPRGYRVAFQDRDDEVRFERQSFLRLPPGPTVQDQQQRRVELRLSLGVGPAGDPWLLRVNDAVPAPQMEDWDGDGDLDVIALRGDLVLVWILEERAFHGPRSYGLAVQERTTFDPAYVARVADVNGDRRADVIMGSSRTRDSEVTSTVAVWVQGEEPMESPSDRLRFRGFAGLVDLEDVDGDGYPELVVGSIRTDLIDALTAGKQQLDAQLNVLRNGYRDGEGFVRPVALVHSMSVRASLDADRITATFFTDVDGDGLKDLLVQDGRRRIQVMLLQETGDGLSLSEPVWETRVEGGARVESLGGKSLLVVENDQVVFVRFR